MTRSESAMVPLGTKMPEFSLSDVTSGKTVSLRNLREKDALLAIFLCRHCRFVQHLEGELARMARDYLDRNLGIVAIGSNDAEVYPEDAPQSLKLQAKDAGFPFPYLYDETQEVARAFGATCTPDFFLFGKTRRLVYRGQFDGSRPDNDVAVTGEDLRRAIDALLQGKPIPAQQRPSSGTAIQWRQAPAKL